MIAGIRAFESLMQLITNAAFVFPSLGGVLLVFVFNPVNPSLGLGASLSYIIYFLAEHKSSYFVQ